MDHSGAGIADLCAWLHELSGGHPERVHAGMVGIEVPHGAVVEMLLEREVQVYAINPKQIVDRFRDRFTVAGAKDDRRDARVLADSLRTDARGQRHGRACVRSRTGCSRWRARCCVTARSLIHSTGLRDR